MFFLSSPPHQNACFSSKKGQSSKHLPPLKWLRDMWTKISTFDVDKFTKNEKILFSTEQADMAEMAGIVYMASNRFL